MLANEDGDGDAARVPNLKEISPENTGNLVKVPEAIITIEFSVYTKDLSFPVDGWDSLKKYHNGAVLGTKLSEKNIPGKVTFLPTVDTDYRGFHRDSQRTPLLLSRPPRMIYSCVPDGRISLTRTGRSGEPEM
ncbi:MAG: hypothetical protein SRB1_02825 [Desulfobacteraceae bacterium Eth-SRB1]|nr:MAG: hypothetical protein SRB1_02825 [Desulfobacteraceae bacterium Eth-SRB1]